MDADAPKPPADVISENKKANKTCYYVHVYDAARSSEGKKRQKPG